jgi:hypothetical protein
MIIRRKSKWKYLFLWSKLANTAIRNVFNLQLRIAYQIRAVIHLWEWKPCTLQVKVTLSNKFLEIFTENIDFRRRNTSQWNLKLLLWWVKFLHAYHDYLTWITRRSSGFGKWIFSSSEAFQTTINITGNCYILKQTFWLLGQIEFNPLCTH